MRKTAFLFAFILLLVLPPWVRPPVVYPDTLRLPPDSVAAEKLGERPLCLVSADSRYQWEKGELLPLEGFFSFYSADQRPLQPRYGVSQEASRGEALRGYFLFNESVDRLAATLEQGSGDLRIRVSGFPLDDAGQDWCFLLGIPSTAEAGAYSLTVRAFRGRRFVVYRDEVEIRHKRFRSEKIAFNRSLSDLMTRPDPRKVEELQELRDLLFSFHSRAVFHTGSLSIPVEATRRTSEFADRRLYSYTDGGSSRSLHNGIDLAAPVGTPVFASGAGRVALAKERIISGNTVVIEHLPGVFTLYYHLEELEVEEGQRLHQGQRIGTVGMTGLATGPHLHWELRVCGVAVDPEFLTAIPMIDKTVFSHNIIERNLQEGR
jgi:hypothetical protein